MKTKPRFVIDTDEKLKRKVKLKTVVEKTTISKIVLDYLNRWVKK